jgi:hypothetical protein
LAGAAATLRGRRLAGFFGLDGAALATAAAALARRLVAAAAGAAATLLVARLRRDATPVRFASVPPGFVACFVAALGFDLPSFLITFFAAFAAAPSANVAFVPRFFAAVLGAAI